MLAANNQAIVLRALGTNADARKEHRVKGLHLALRLALQSRLQLGLHVRNHAVQPA
jgi:hypothetical protein